MNPLWLISFFIVASLFVAQTELACVNGTGKMEVPRSGRSNSLRGWQQNGTASAILRDPPKKHRYCGQVLAEVLALVCKGSFDPDIENRANDTKVAQSKAVTKPKRDKRGIVEECCVNMCTTDELKEYCRN